MKSPISKCLNKGLCKFLYTYILYIFYIFRGFCVSELSVKKEEIKLTTDSCAAKEITVIFGQVNHRNFVFFPR